MCMYRMGGDVPQSLVLYLNILWNLGQFQLHGLLRYSLVWRHLLLQKTEPAKWDWGTHVLHKRQLVMKEKLRELQNIKISRVRIKNLGWNIRSSYVLPQSVQWIYCWVLPLQWWKQLPCSHSDNGDGGSPPRYPHQRQRMSMTVLSLFLLLSPHISQWLRWCEWEEEVTMSELLTGNPERYLTETGEELMELLVCHVSGCNGSEVVDI